MSSYELNRFMYDLLESEQKRAYQQDPREFVAGYQLSDEEQALIEARDWAGLHERGVSVYILANLGSALGLTLFDLGASFRGETPAQLSEFLGEQNERIAEFAILPEASVNG